MTNLLDIDWSYRWTRRDDVILAGVSSIWLAMAVGALLGY